MVYIPFFAIRCCGLGSEKGGGGGLLYIHFTVPSPFYHSKATGVMIPFRPPPGARRVFSLSVAVGQIHFTPAHFSLSLPLFTQPAASFLLGSLCCPSPPLVTIFCMIVVGADIGDPKAATGSTSHARPRPRRRRGSARSPSRPRWPSLRSGSRTSRPGSSPPSSTRHRPRRPTRAAAAAAAAAAGCSV